MDNKEKALRLFFSQMDEFELPSFVCSYSISLFQHLNIDPMIHDINDFYKGSENQKGVFVKEFTDNNPLTYGHRDLKEGEYFIRVYYNDIGFMCGSAADVNVYFKVENDKVIILEANCPMYMMS